MRLKGFRTARVYVALAVCRDVLKMCRGATFDWICPKLTPSSSISGGSPSYPSVENAANQPVLNPPCSPILPDTPPENPPGGAPNP